MISSVVEMAPGKPCQHCISEGCAIYPDRPRNPCQTYRCAWLREDGGLPEDFRPDICGAIVSLGRVWNGWTVIRATPTGAEIPGATLDWIKAYAVRLNIPLMIQQNLVEDGQYGAAKILGYGPPEFVAEVRNAINVDDIIKL